MLFSREVLNFVSGLASQRLACCFQTFRFKCSLTRCCIYHHNHSRSTIVFKESNKFCLWFKGHEQLHSAAMKRGWWFIYAQEPGVDRGFMLAERSGKCVYDVTKFFEKKKRASHSIFLPLYVEHCFQCHKQAGEFQEGERLF